MEFIGVAGFPLAALVSSQSTDVWVLTLKLPTGVNESGSEYVS